MRAGIYLGWVGNENLGDEAIFNYCRERFSSLRWSSFEQLLYAPNIPQFVARRGRSFCIKRDCGKQP